MNINSKIVETESVYNPPPNHLNALTLSVRERGIEEAAQIIIKK